MWDDEYKPYLLYSAALRDAGWVDAIIADVFPRSIIRHGSLSVSSKKWHEILELDYKIK